MPLSGKQSEATPGPRFRPRLWPTLAAAALIPLFIAAGQWQWGKAELKAERQCELDLRQAQPAVTVPATIADPLSFEYRHAMAHGYYESQHEILIDNQVRQGRAGYHVVTPLRLEGSEMRVLVNRGWVPALPERREVPATPAPQGLVEVDGTAVIPSQRFFTLQQTGPQDGPERVWQNLDLARYRSAARFPIQPFVIELSPDSSAGGYVREWRRPDDRRQVNVGYAFQWWGFAATTVALWLFFSFRRKS